MAHRVGMIGGGNMGGAIVRGAVRAGVLQPHELIVADVEPTKLQSLRQIGCEVTSDAKLAANAEQIILAIKPQVFAEVANEIGPLDASRIVISIMAGINSNAIRDRLGGSARVIRAMPNVACQVGAGMTGIALGAGARRGDEQLALSLFNALGRTVIVDEALMYAVTAVSGSGPAYVFVLAEAMEQAAVALGIKADDARLLVSETILGAGRLLAESGQSAQALRRSVTSPGGTTAAALKVFEERGFIDLMIDALTAARDRGIELDKK